MNREEDTLDVARFRVAVDQDRPFPPRGTKFWLWLTRDEWRAAFAGSFAEQMADEMDPRLPKDQAMQMWIADRHREDGYEWQGVAVRDDGRIIPKSEKPIEMGNLVLVKKYYFLEQVLPLMLEEQQIDIEMAEILSQVMTRGEGGMDWFYVDHVEAAIPWLEQNIPSYDVAPMRRALGQIEQDRQTAAVPMPPHIRQEVEKIMEQFANQGPELVN